MGNDLILDEVGESLGFAECNVSARLSAAVENGFIFGRWRCEIRSSPEVVDISPGRVANGYDYCPRIAHELQASSDVDRSEEVCIAVDQVAKIAEIVSFFPVAQRDAVFLHRLHGLIVCGNPIFSPRHRPCDLNQISTLLGLRSPLIGVGETRGHVLRARLEIQAHLGGEGFPGTVLCTYCLTSREDESADPGKRWISDTDLINFTLSISERWTCDPRLNSFYPFLRVAWNRSPSFERHLWIVCCRNNLYWFLMIDPGENTIILKARSVGVLTTHRLCQYLAHLLIPLLGILGRRIS